MTDRFPKPDIYDDHFKRKEERPESDPDFVHTRRRYQKKPSERRSVYEKSIQKNKTVYDTLKENSTLVIVFALIIVILVLVIVWLMMKKDNANKQRRRAIGRGPPYNPHHTQSPPMQRRDNIEPSVHHATPPPISKPEESHEPKEPKVSSTEELMMSVDDKELDEVINSEDKGDVVGEINEINEEEPDDL